VQAEREIVWSGRLKGPFAVVNIGGRVLELLAPKQHSLLWNAAPKTTRKLACFFADSPNYMRLLGRTQIGFSLWLAFRQYRKA
jgi:hypothetical protein